MTFRKTILFSLLSLFFVFNLFSADGYFIGDGAKGKRILVYEYTVENGNKSEEWIASKIKRDLITDLVNFSDMDIIDSDEKSTIRKLQKDSLSTVYSENDPIELGKMIQAKSYVRLITTCKKNTYSLTATLTNIETGKTESSFTSSFYSENDYISKVHGETAECLLESLGVKLTLAGKRLLQYGSFTQTINESLENLETYKAEIARLEKEQAELKTNRITEIDTQALNARIEVQKATLLQQQKNEEDRLERLKQDTKRKQEEERLSKERNSESQKRILKLSNEIEARAEKIRQEKKENMSAIQQIEIIEGEKQILAKNEIAINENIEDFNNAQNIACEKEIEERQKQKPRKSDINPDGTLNDSGRQILNSDIEAIRLKYDNLKAENIKELDDTAGKMQEQLRKKIIDDIKVLQNKIYTADSLLNEGCYFRVENYDGSQKNEGWKYIISFVFDGKTVYNSEGILSYKEITGKDVPEYPTATDSNRENKIKIYNEYQDNVEIYDSFFRLNVPYIQAIISYSIKAENVEKPSCYSIIIKQIEFINIQTGESIKSILQEDSNIYEYEPKTNVDWRLKSARVRAKRKAERQAIREQKTKNPFIINFITKHPVWFFIAILLFADTL